MGQQLNETQGGCVSAQGVNMTTLGVAATPPPGGDGESVFVPEFDLQTGNEKKGPRLARPNIDPVEAEDVLMNRLEMEEKKTLHIATEDYYMAMTICEKAVDMSCMNSREGEDA